MTELLSGMFVRGVVKRGIVGSLTNGPRIIRFTAWRHHRDLMGTAATLVGTTGVTAVLGFAYWAVAARLFTQEAVGYGAATVSAMTLLGTIGMLGLNTVLIGELPRRSARAGLVSAALLASGAGSLVLGLTFAIAAPHFSARFVGSLGSFGEIALFAAGVVLIGVSLVFDHATIGLFRGGLQLKRNVFFATAKLLLLPAFALILHDQVGVGIAASWVCGIALSMVVMTISLKVPSKLFRLKPNWSVLRKLGKTTLAHNWLNLATSLPLSLIPVLVTIIISPTANAAFYAAWTLVNFLRIVPIHLGTVLFAVTSANPQVIARKLRFTLKLSLVIGLPGMAVLGFGAHLALSLFGAGYARIATLPLELLVIGYLPSIPKVHYLAVCRVAGRVPRAAAVMTIAFILEIGAVVAGGMSDGLKGLSIALLAVYLFEGIVTTPPMLRAAFARGNHRYVPGLPIGFIARYWNTSSPARSSDPKGNSTMRRPGGPIEAPAFYTTTTEKGQFRSAEQITFDRHLAENAQRSGPAARPARGRHRRSLQYLFLSRAAELREGKPKMSNKALKDPKGPNVSVVIITVNRATVRMAVASVLDQTYPPLEVIVVVDNADRFVHPALDDVLGKIRLVYTGGVGQAGARLRGTMEAHGEVVAYLDDDDEWLPEKLERQLALWPMAAEARPHTLICSSILMVDRSGQPLKSLPSRMYSERERMASYLFRRTSLGYGEGLLHPSSLICDRALIDAEPWDPSVRRHEDWDWLLRIGARSDVAIGMCPEVLVKVATGGRSLKANWELSLRFLQSRIGQLTPRESGDFLLCCTATSAIRARSRRGGLIAAAQALRCGRPGLTAWVVWLLHMISPGMVDRASRLQCRLTQVKLHDAG